MRKIRRRQRCPNCKSLDVIRWGNGRQRYHCSNCGVLFTSRRPDVSIHNRFVWFRKWVLGKQSLASLSGESGYSERQLRRWFSEYLENVPEWTVPRHKGIHLLIDGTWLPDGRCIIVYRDYDRKSITFLCRRHIANGCFFVQKSAIYRFFLNEILHFLIKLAKFY